VYLEDVEGVEDAAVGGDPTSVEGEATKREGKKLPFGLQTEDIPRVGQLVADHPGIAEAMKQLMAAPLAASTMKGYDHRVRIPI